MSSLPEELYLDILLRLPVKSTLVCKCVCKNWYALISNPCFVRTHHNLTIERTNFSLMVSMFDNTNMYSVSYDPSSLSSDEFHLFGLETDKPLGCLDFGMPDSWELVGSSKGLICIWNLRKGVFGLWNPESKEYKELTECYPDPQDLNKFTCAFGYDYKTGDYKLIRLYENGDGSLVVDVYTMGLNSWKSTEVVDFEIYGDEKSGTLANGSFHWIGSGTDDNEIISLDISNETFKELQLPDVSLQDSLSFLSLGSLKDCLCVLAYAVNVEVWVMQDYGVTESWTRHYTITNDRILEQCYNLRPMWSFNSGSILFASFSCRHTNLVFLYDPKDGSARKPNIHIFGSEEGTSYVESLVVY